MNTDNLEALKVEEASLRKRLAEIEREKREATLARRQAEEEERKRIDREKAVTVSVLAYAGGARPLQIQFEERFDLRELVEPRASYTREKFVSVPEWIELEKKILALPNVSIEWKGDTAEKYDWHLNAPAWEVDLAITGEIICRAGPGESHRLELQRIPGARFDYAKREYSIPRMESWRIPEALKRTEDVSYTDAARRVIFEEIEKRDKLDSIAAQEDSSCLRGGLQGNQLRPFQRVGCEFGVTSGGRFLLGDDTGLGKTWEGIGIGKILAANEDHAERSFQTLCVVKAANIPNWVREIKRLTNEEPFICVSGKPDGEAMHKILTERVSFVLISYDTLGSKTYTKKHIDKSSTDGFYPWTQIFQSAVPDMLILDEAHQIKNSGTHRFKAVKPLSFIQHVIPMTASPILNRAAELWTLLHMVAPHQFTSYEGFLNRYTYDGRAPKDIDKLHELIRPMFLRRRKKDVLKDLPPINRINRYHTLSPRAEKLYQRVLQGIYLTLEHYDPLGRSGMEKEVIGILSQITRLKQICAADKVEYTADLATELVDENVGKKVLIYSQFKGAALSIAQRLGQNAVCTVERTPTAFNSLTAIQRDALFERVRVDESVQFVVTTQAAKEGHNLEFCDFVIFNDLFWTPEGHRQCEGRAYGRLSDPHPIDSYYIVADVEIEKWIMELLEKKMALIEEIIDKVESTRDPSGSITMELIQRVKDQMMRQGRRAG